MNGKGGDRLCWQYRCRPQRIESRSPQPELGRGLEVATRTRFDIGEEVGEAGVRVLALLDVALHAAEEGVLRNVGNQLTQDAGPLVVGDGVEVQVDGLDVGDVAPDWVGVCQLILP